MDLFLRAALNDHNITNGVDTNSINHTSIAQFSSENYTTSATFDKQNNIFSHFRKITGCERNIATITTPLTNHVTK